MSEPTQSKVGTSIMWKTTEVVIKKVISTVVTIILARLLSAEDYGIVSLTTIFLTFAAIFIQSGFCTALIRERNLKDKDISTVAFFNILISLVLYILIFISAPYLSEFYGSNAFKTVLRVIAIIIIIQSYYSVPMALVTREMNFKVLSVSGTVSSIVSGIVGVIMAYLGLGVWALVGQQLVSYIIDAILISRLTHYRLRVSWARETFNKMSRFSIGTMATSFLDFLGNNSTGMLLGKFLSVEHLGYYNKGVMLPEIVGLNIYNIINATSLPALSASSRDREELHKQISRYVCGTAFILLPVMLGLFAVSDYAIPVLLTDKWNSAIPVMKCFCLIYLINPVRAIAYNTLYALGKSRTNAIIEIIRCVLLICGTYIALVIVHGDISVLAMTVAFVCMLVSICSFIYVMKSISIPIADMVKDIGKTLIITIIMLLVITPIRMIQLSALLKLISMIVLGCAVFITLGFVTHNRNFTMITAFVGKIRKR